MIEKKDILKILDKLSDRYGYLDKNILLSAIISMKEVESKTFIIKNADILRGNIIQYQRRVSLKTEKGYLTEHIERIYHLSGKHEISICIGEEIVTDRDIVILSNDLSTVLNVSKPTVLRLKELGIIEQHESKGVSISIDHKKVDYKYKNGWIYYYDLNDIREKLNSYIKKR